MSGLGYICGGHEMGRHASAAAACSVPGGHTHTPPSATVGAAHAKLTAEPLHALPSGHPPKSASDAAVHGISRSQPALGAVHALHTVSLRARHSVSRKVRPSMHALQGAMTASEVLVHSVAMYDADALLLHVWQRQASMSMSPRRKNPAEQFKVHARHAPALEPLQPR